MRDVLDVDEIIMVIRAFPIRVEGNSGALENEINWDASLGKSQSCRALQKSKKNS